MNTSEIHELLVEQLSESKISGVNLEAIDPWIEVAPHGLVEVCRYLRDDPDLQLNLLNCISGVDYFIADPKKAAKAPWEPHIEVVYHLSSTTRKHTLVLKVILPRWKDDTEGQLPEVPSVSSVWSSPSRHSKM